MRKKMAFRNCLLYFMRNCKIPIDVLITIATPMISPWGTSYGGCGVLKKQMWTTRISFILWRFSLKRLWYLSFQNYLQLEILLSSQLDNVKAGVKCSRVVLSLRTTRCCHLLLAASDSSSEEQNPEFTHPLWVQKVVILVVSNYTNQC